MYFPDIVHTPELTLNLPSQPFDLPRPFKDSKGIRRQPGLKDLPQWLRETFRDRFIRRVIERVCLNNAPWNNLSLSSLQQEFNCAYLTHRIRLHSDDAGVILVSFGRHSNTGYLRSHKYPDTSGSWSPSKSNWE
jgi:hypothetical protein